MSGAMRFLNHSLLVLSSLFFATQVWGYHVHFRSVGRPPLQLRALSAVSVLAFVAQLAALWPTRQLPGGAWPSILVYIAALGLWGWSVCTTGQRRLSLAFSPDTPAALITDGPYRFVRHPFYLAYLLYWLAGCLATVDLFVAGTSLAAVGLCVGAARREERKFAASPMAAAYHDYSARTGMFFPLLLR